MKNILLNLWREEQGQDLIEYTLLLAFVCLAAAALFIPTGSGIANIWGDTSTIVSSAATIAASAVS